MTGVGKVSSALMVLCVCALVRVALVQAQDANHSGLTCEERVLQVRETLDPTNPMRVLIEQGHRGEGIHHAWMDTMKRVGVKAVTVEVRFAWDGQFRNLEVGSIEYFKDYYSESPPIADTRILELIRAEGLEGELKEFALSVTRDFGPRELRNRGYKRAHGTFGFFLVDNECLPKIVPPDEIKDDDFSELMEASREGDLTKVDALIRQGAEVNQPDHLGMTALMYAAGAGATDVVKLLVAAGAELEAVNRHGETALMIAVRTGQHQTVKGLLQVGANAMSGVNLWSAAFVGDLEMVQLLLRAGASPNARGPKGTTALMMAARRGDAAIVKTLLESGADPNIKDDLDRTALSLAEWEARHAPARVSASGPADYAEVARMLKTAGGRQ